MKRIILSMVFVAAVIASFCQQTTSSHALTREEYFTKSKNQRSAARVLLIGGGAVIATALALGSSSENSFDAAATWAIVGGVGFLATIGSIPLFIASSRNKKKAKAATAYFKMERVTPSQSQILSYHSYPALSVRINL